MSHFLTLVLLTPPEPAEMLGPEEANELLEPIMAPYSEEFPVAPYKRPCWCRGSAAKTRAREHADTQCGAIRDLREEFHKRADVSALQQEREALYRPRGEGVAESPEERETRRKRQRELDDLLQKMWLDDVYNPWEAAERAYLEIQQDRDAPAADCEDCKGAGEYVTMSNPKGYWDWYQLGGRWSGYLVNYDPESDPAKQETCFLCRGTGKRNDELGKQMRAENPAFTCNGCDGTGKSLQWPTAWEAHPADLMPLAAVLEGWLPETHTPYALVTADGIWHQRGKMGWFGTSSDDVDGETWQKFVLEQLRAHDPARTIVATVDCHT